MAQQVQTDQQVRLGTAEGLFGLPVAPAQPDQSVLIAAHALAAEATSGKSPTEIQTALIRILDELPAAERYAAQEIFTSIIAQTNANVDKEAAKLAVQSAVAKIDAQQAQNANLALEEIIAIQHAYQVYGAALINAVAQAAGISSDETALRSVRLDAEDRAIFGEVKHETVAQQAAFQNHHVAQITEQVAQGTQSADPQIQAAVANLQKQAHKAAKGEAAIVLSQDTEFDVANLLHAKFGGNSTIGQYVKDPRIGAGVVLLEILQQLDQRGVYLPDMYIGGGMEPAQALQALANRDPDQFAMATYSSSHLGSAGVYDRKEVEMFANYVWTNIDVNLDRGQNLIDFGDLAQRLMAQAEDRQPSYKKAVRSEEYDASQSLVGTALEVNNEWRTTIAENVAGRASTRTQ